MKRWVRLFVMSAILIIVVAIPFYCLSQKNANDLIRQTKEYVKAGDKNKAIETLDAAFLAASQNKDVGALMDIGDLYIKIDTSLKDRAVKAWTEAGHLKCDR